MLHSQVIKRDDVLILETVETDSDVPDALPQVDYCVATFPESI